METTQKLTGSKPADKTTQDGNFRHGIAYLIVGGSLLILFLLFFIDVPVGNKDMFNFISGALMTTGLASVIRSYFPTKLEQVDKPSGNKPVPTNTPQQGGESSEV